MFRRIAKVNAINIQSIDLSSQLQIGDSHQIIGRSRILAVQREQEFFFGNEGSLNQYPIFNRPIHLPPITKPLYEKKENIVGIIHVNHLSVIGAAGSAIVHIGNNDFTFMESKTKHIRQNAK
ncbi:spore germination protein GerPE [Fervidibacillus halotolerans]|uniref:Spore germination protein GerPE n=1 Tax=Fervidibacillus halotolerans TaxID=2980027 RepID=A0A9E8S107_9BACI|nr:spore germination protein GerPE [Fervidibacillus halotolerans]WAA13037.1 spore germination protein GerPE [Fervidibacillus halotolerans]